MNKDPAQLMTDLFWSKVRRGDESACWPWVGCKDQSGYGTVGSNYRVLKAHRHAYALTFGSIPPGMLVCHHCDNPPCCNPSHLFLGTYKDNAEDRDRKGRCRWRHGEEHSMAKLTAADVHEIRYAIMLGAGRTELARLFGISRNNIHRIANQLTWVSR